MDKLVASTLEGFKSGDLVADLQYIRTEEKIKITSMTFREPWAWDDENEPAFFTLDIDNMRMSVYGLKQSDLDDGDTVKALMLSELL